MLPPFDGPPMDGETLILIRGEVNQIW